MRALYKIRNEYKILFDHLMEKDEITEEDLNEIHSLEGDLQTKSIAIGSIIKNMEVESNGIKNAFIDIKLRYERIEKKIFNLKKYLKENMEDCNLKEIKSPYFDIKIKNNPSSVAINDETILPENYIITIATKKIDKISLSRDLKNNIDIPGAYLARTTRVEIK